MGLSIVEHALSIALEIGLSSYDCCALKRLLLINGLRVIWGGKLVIDVLVGNILRQSESEACDCFLVLKTDDDLV